MPRWNKQDLFNLLEDRAFIFATWCTQSRSKDAKAVSFIVENSDEFDFNHALWQDEIFPILLKNKVVDQAFLDRVNAFIGT